MQGDPSTIDPQGLISIAQYPEIRDWCVHLGCTEIELAEALALVGNSPNEVRMFLAKLVVQRSAG